MSLGFGLSSRSRLAPHALATLAAEAERAGFDWLFTNELGSDALLTSALPVSVTQRATIATGACSRRADFGPMPRLSSARPTTLRP